jgi:hypothetical protein
VLRKAYQLILHGRTKQERGKAAAMQTPKDVNPSSSNKPSTTRDELKLVCRKIADVDALWRTSDSQESQPLKRAA